jgi:hypothetical protein
MAKNFLPTDHLGMPKAACNNYLKLHVAAYNCLQVAATGYKCLERTYGLVRKVFQSINLNNQIIVLPSCLYFCHCDEALMTYKLIGDIGSMTYGQKPFTDRPFWYA